MPVSASRINAVTDGGFALRQQRVVCHQPPASLPLGEATRVTARCNGAGCHGETLRGTLFPVRAYPSRLLQRRSTVCPASQLVAFGVKGDLHLRRTTTQKVCRHLISRSIWKLENSEEPGAWWVEALHTDAEHLENHLALGCRPFQK